MLSDGRRVVVDNEVSDGVFVIGDEGSQVYWPLPQAARDFEAVVVHDGVISVIGSHSRKKLKDGVCRIDRRRSMIGWGPVDDLTAFSWFSSPYLGSFTDVPDCLNTIFGSAPVAGANVVCQALVASDKAASTSKRACRETLNIEGAAVVDGRLWVGLRSPRVDDAAVLLRLVGGWPVTTGLVADSVVLLSDVEGIRALSSHDDRLHIVTGGDDFKHWSVRHSELLPGARVSPHLHGSVPDSTEGLVVRESVMGVTDGSAATVGCREVSESWRTEGVGPRMH